MLYRERGAAQYARTVSLPAEVDPAASQAKVENGVLTLTLAKKVATGRALRSASADLRGGRERPARPHVEGIVRCAGGGPRCSRIAAASAIIAPLSVQSCSSG